MKPHRHHHYRAWAWLFLASLLVWLAPAAAGDGEKHLLWRMEGARNTVYLLGSVHFLRDSDYPLAP